MRGNLFIDSTLIGPIIQSFKSILLTKIVQNNRKHQTPESSSDFQVFRIIWQPDGGTKHNSATETIASNSSQL